MIVGFTGTRTGMTSVQKKVVKALLSFADEFSHGDCLGADAEAHDLALELGLYVTIHPPTDPKYRAWCEADDVREPKPYLPRNREIVRECDVLIGAPGQIDEVVRSGTWSTIRYAEKIGKPVVIVYPTGEVTKGRKE